MQNWPPVSKHCPSAELFYGEPARRLPSRAPSSPDDVDVLGRRRSLTGMRAVQITRFGGPEVLDVVDLPDPTPGDGQQLYDVSTAGINFADTHHRLSAD
jgi:hypothetical protein